jgi:hypothetical protein
MLDDRDVFAKVLAAPFDRETAERARLKFIELQTLVDAIDRAIATEKICQTPDCDVGVYPARPRIEG